MRSQTLPQRSARWAVIPGVFLGTDGGEAVAIGMVCASRLAERLGRIEADAARARAEGRNPHIIELDEANAVV